MNKKNRGVPHAAAMPGKKSQLQIVSRRSEPRDKDPDGARTAPPTVSGRWILGALAVMFVAAAFCAWGSLALLFWQGYWQLLYHPAAKVTRKPASVGLAFDPVGFDVTETGSPRLRGWWVPAAPGAPLRRYTVLYLHGQNGNLGGCVDALAALHRAGVNAMAFDYRGYGESEFVHPSEKHWRQDAESALEYLTGTRQIGAGTIVLEGAELGANLALEVAAAHPELAGVVLEAPLEAPLQAIYGDPRSRLIPAHLLVSDRYDSTAAAVALRVPSLWFFSAALPTELGSAEKTPPAYRAVTAQKIFVRVPASTNRQKDFADALSRWLDGLHGGDAKP